MCSFKPLISGERNVFQGFITSSGCQWSGVSEHGDAERFLFEVCASLPAGPVRIDNRESRCWRIDSSTPIRARSDGVSSALWPVESVCGQRRGDSYLLGFDVKDNWIVFVWSRGWACFTLGVSQGKRCTWVFSSCASENNFIQLLDACSPAISLWTFADNSRSDVGRSGWRSWTFSKMLSEMIMVSWKKSEKRQDWVV